MLFQMQARGLIVPTSAGGKILMIVLGFILLPVLETHGFLLKMGGIKKGFLKGLAVTADVN